MILPSAPVRYLLTQKTNYGLGQGHSASPSRVRTRNGGYSDCSRLHGDGSQHGSGREESSGLADGQSALNVKLDNSR